VFTWLQRWLGGRPVPSPPASEQVLSLERQLQELRLTLQEREAQLVRLQADLERQRQEHASRIEEALQQEREKWIREAAGPVSQLLTQAHLVEVENKPVQPRDIVAVARRLIRLLEEQGLEWIGKVGEVTAFDANRHAPLAGEPPAANQPVRVRFVGVGLRGRVIRKAGVEVHDAGTTGR
jgi:molecular chaperone GrpE (heat shock protein)